MFELVTSEASYYKSLEVLETHFLRNTVLTSTLSQSDMHFLFSNIEEVMKASERWDAKTHQHLGAFNVTLSGFFQVLDGPRAPNWGVNFNFWCVRHRSPPRLEALWRFHHVRRQPGLPGENLQTHFVSMETGTGGTKGFIRKGCCSFVSVNVVSPSVC